MNRIESRHEYVNVRFENLDHPLDYRVFVSGELEDVTFIDCDLTAVRFMNIMMRRIHFDNCHFSFSTFDTGGITVEDVTAVNCVSPDYRFLYDPNTGRGKVHTATEDVTVWKKARYVPGSDIDDPVTEDEKEILYYIQRQWTYHGASEFVLVQCTLKKGTRYIIGHGNKCRAEALQVDRIFAPSGLANMAWSIHDRHFSYRLGKVVKPRDKFSLNTDQTCGAGIHFFFDQKGALRY